MSSETNGFAPLLIQQEITTLLQRQQQLAERLDTMGVLIANLTTRVEGLDNAITYEMAGIKKDVLDIQNKPARFEKLITPFIIVNASLSFGTLGLVITLVILLINHLLG